MVRILVLWPILAPSFIGQIRSVHSPALPYGCRKGFIWKRQAPFKSDSFFISRKYKYTPLIFLKSPSLRQQNRLFRFQNCIDACFLLMKQFRRNLLFSFSWKNLFENSIEWKLKFEDDPCPFKYRKFLCKRWSTIMYLFNPLFVENQFSIKGLEPFTKIGYTFFYLDSFEAKHKWFLSYFLHDQKSFWKNNVHLITNSISQTNIFILSVFIMEVVFLWKWEIRGGTSPPPVTETSLRSV